MQKESFAKLIFSVKRGIYMLISFLTWHTLYLWLLTLPCSTMRITSVGGMAWLSSPLTSYRGSKLI